jgi:uncharacterized protein (DUF2141 family)
MTTKASKGRVQWAAALIAALLLAPLAARAELAACTGDPAEVRLRVSVTGVRNDRGGVMLTLYPDDSARFLASKGKLGKISVPAHAGITEACIAAPGPGAYALAVYHDENGDGKLGRTWIGLPAEGYGFSNDAPASIGLPRFQDARFTAQAGDNALRIALRY